MRLELLKIVGVKSGRVGVYGTYDIGPILVCLKTDEILNSSVNRVKKFHFHAGDRNG